LYPSDPRLDAFSASHRTSLTARMALTSSPGVNPDEVFRGFSPPVRTSANPIMDSRMMMMTATPVDNMVSDEREFGVFDFSPPSSGAAWTVFGLSC